MRKRRFIVCIIIVILISFSACNDDANPYDNITIEAEETTEELEPVDIVFYVRGYGTDGQPRGISSIEDMLEQVEIELQDTLKVRPRFNWTPNEDYEERIIELISSGENIDAFAVYNNSNMNKYVQQNLVMDLTQLLPRYAPGYYQELMTNKMGKDYLEASSVYEKLYCIPYNDISSPRYCIVARKDLIDKYTADGFETLEDYGLFLEQVKNGEEGIMPGIVYAREFFDAYFKGNGYYADFDSGFYTELNALQKEIIPIAETAEFSSAYNLFRKWKESGIIARNNMTANRTYSLRNGTLASQMTNINNINYLYLPKTEYFDFGIYPLYINSIHVLSGFAQGISISISSSYPERVISFMEWLHKNQYNYDLFANGTDGKDYMLEGETIYYPDEVESPMETGWFSTVGLFTDYRYERSYFYNPDNYIDIKKQACFTKVLTQFELSEKFGKISLEKQERLWKEYEGNSEILIEYNEIMNTIAEAVDSGDFSIGIEDIKRQLQESGVKTITEYYRRLYDLDE